MRDKMFGQGLMDSSVKVIRNWPDGKLVVGYSGRKLPRLKSNTESGLHEPVPARERKRASNALLSTISLKRAQARFSNAERGSQ